MRLEDLSLMTSPNNEPSQFVYFLHRLLLPRLQAVDFSSMAVKAIIDFLKVPFYHLGPFFH